MTMLKLYFQMGQRNKLPTITIGFPSYGKICQSLHYWVAGQAQEKNSEASWRGLPRQVSPRLERGWCC